MAKIVAMEPGVRIILGNVCPEVDSVGGNGPSSDGYDGYGASFTFRRKQTGVVEVELDDNYSRILGAIGTFETTIAKALICTVEHPCPKSGTNNTVRFRFLDKDAVETDLEHNDRFHFVIWADYL